MRKQAVGTVLARARWARWFEPLGRLLRGSIRIAGVIVKLGRGLAAISAGRAILLGLIPALLVFVTSVAVGATADLLRIGDLARARGELSVALIVFALILLLQAGVATSGLPVGQTIARKVDGALRARVLDAALTPDGLEHLESDEVRAAFDAARNISPSLRFTPGNAAASLVAVVAERIRICCFVALMLFVAWPIGLTLVPVTLLMQNEIQKSMGRLLSASVLRTTSAEATYDVELATGLNAAKEVRVFGLGSWLSGRYEHSMLGFLQRAWEARREFTPSLVVVLGLQAAVTITGLVVLGLSAARGALGVSRLALGVAALLALTPRISLDDTRITETIGALDLVERVETASSKLANTAAVRAVAAGLPNTSVRFEHVTFAYPGSPIAVLDGFDLELRAGERTALVGVNGAGKTTIVKLLAKLYQPTGGRILVDGRDLRDLDTDSWRRQLAVLFQDFTPYELSALDNVRFGALHAAGDGRDRAELAAQRGNADDIISNLANGWETVLSSRYPGGQGLSGGQWQRIGLARVLYAMESGAHVVVFDEPTANLDVRAEADLYERFVDLTSAKVADRPITTLLISHRFSTVQLADRIVLLSDGRIVEDGPHERLLSLGGHYAAMFTAQAQRYVDEQPAP